MWFEIEDTGEIRTPTMAIYLDRIQANIHEMHTVAGTANQLCPHVKTHKSRHILARLVQSGISQFKSATLSELRMLVANEGVQFALHAMQLVYQQLHVFLDIAKEHQHVALGVVVDNPKCLEELGACAADKSVSIQVLLDLNNGMNRTGIPPSNQAFDLYRRILDYPSLEPGGLHVYDGHIRDSDIVERTKHVNEAMIEVVRLRDHLVADGCPVPRVVAGGTPSFPVHAQHADRICSPGTTTLWDAGYGHLFPDMKFLPAAVMLTRIVSHVDEDVYCLDLGHKAVAAEMRPPRLQFLNVRVKEELSHSEEHLVVRVEEGERLEVGQLVYAIPWHICPSVARHSEMLAVDQRKVVDHWDVTARDYCSAETSQAKSVQWAVN